MKLTYDQANEALSAGRINGFAIGERCFAKRDTYVFSDGCKVGKPISRGLHLIARTFSRTGVGFIIDGQKWHGLRKDFGLFPDGKVVLETY